MLVTDSLSDKNALRDCVEELFGQLLRTVRLGLWADGAKMIRYIWVGPKVPVLGKNSISAGELWLNDQNKDIKT
ncbi:hypothetical protein FRC04_007116 [Tulasnella sp. 424]|nr:hypothetical protein FRC04_007116 [Tulasnella sp. 424]KAG8960072.1 hypothetical protein FRC05_007123 [Tulasnella sp. 425]